MMRDDARQSPRTVEEPMEFTPDEFRRGAMAAWGIFMLLLVCALIVPAVQQSGPPWGPPLSMIALYLMFGVPIGGAVSAVIALIVSPIIRLIARRLSGTPRIGIHLVVYTAFGFVLGIVVTTIWTVLARVDVADVFTTAFPWIYGGMCALSVVGGWAWTVWRARRSTGRQSAADPDARFEDSV